MQRISHAPIFDQSLAYLAGIVSVLFLGIVAFAVSSSDLGFAMDYEDEVKVEAAQFPSDTDLEMSIFAAGCDGKSAKDSCK